MLSREEHDRLAEGGFAVPLTLHLPGDVETPVSAYWKVSHDAVESFLLESVTGGEQLARYSLVGARPRAVLRGRDGSSSCGDGELGDPLFALRGLVRKVRPEAAVGLPRFVGGAVGFIGYDYVRSIERLQFPPTDDLGLEDAVLLIVDDVVVFDHAKSLLTLVCLSDGTPEGYENAKKRIEELRVRLVAPCPELPTSKPARPELTANRTREDYEAAVSRIVEYIYAGDCIQVVPSLRLTAEVTVHPLVVYRALRSLNPSPYMFIVRLDGLDLVGASPELLVGLQGRTATVRPIAGTRPRSEIAAEDARRAEELLADEKERAEHLMLVDLGRNDLGRVCEFGSVAVNDFMVIERYSHVMHIVSSVTGRLSEGLDAIDLVRASFPAGTVSGAPKVRAMEIIDELEPTRRGAYAGAVGYLSTTGDLDLAIAIRTAILKDGKAHVQAGAGIVADSVPAKEYDECIAKADAMLRAIRVAHGG